MQRKLTPIVNLSSIKAACKDCSLKELCLPFGLNEEDIQTLDGLIQRRHKLRKGQSLYRMGEPLRALYAIRSGAIKTSGLMEDGRVQITGFHLPGELLGIDAISSDHHHCNADALENSEVCEVPYHELEVMAGKVPSLQHQLLRIMSREIARDEQMLLTLGRMTAEERVASCMLSFAQRNKRFGLNDASLKLSMSRQDLGDYLGLALETVSRLFSRFQEDGLLEVQGRFVEIRDMDRLQTLASGCAESQRLTPARGN